MTSLNVNSCIQQAGFLQVTMWQSTTLTLPFWKAAFITQLEAERARAERAEKLTRLYEAQLTQPKKEVTTLIHAVGQPEERTKGDAELARHLNEGWEKFECAFVSNPGERTIRYVTLERVAPIPPEPVQPSASAQPAAAEPAPKTVAPSAIVIPGEITPPLDPFDAQLARDLQAKAEEIRRTNPLLNLPHRSFRNLTGVYVQS